MPRYYCPISKVTELHLHFFPACIMSTYSSTSRVSHSARRTVHTSDSNVALTVDNIALKYTVMTSGGDLQHHVEHSEMCIALRQASIYLHLLSQQTRQLHQFSAKSPRESSISSPPPRTRFFSNPALYIFYIIPSIQLFPMEG